jgi:hypothetical protein
MSVGFRLGMMGAFLKDVDESKEENRKAAEDFANKTARLRGVNDTLKQRRKIEDNEASRIAVAALKSQGGQAAKIIEQMSDEDKINYGLEISFARKNYRDRGERLNELAFTQGFLRESMKDGQYVSKYTPAPTEAPSDTDDLESTSAIDRFKSSLFGSGTRDTAAKEYEAEVREGAFLREPRTPQQVVQETSAVADEIKDLKGFERKAVQLAFMTAAGAKLSEEDRELADSIYFTSEQNRRISNQNIGQALLFAKKYKETFGEVAEAGKAAADFARYFAQKRLGDKKATVTDFVTNVAEIEKFVEEEYDGDILKALSAVRSETQTQVQKIKEDNEKPTVLSMEEFQRRVNENLIEADKPRDGYAAYGEGTDGKVYVVKAVEG